MKRQILIGLVALLATSPLLSAEQPAYKPGVVLVRFANVGTQPPNTTAKNTILNSVLQSGGNMVKQEYSLVPGLTKAAIPAGMSVESAVATLKQSSSVLYAEPVYIYQLCAVPNDTRFSELWGMRNIGQTGGTPGADIGATSAWDISTGSNNIIVAVTDTGVDYNHPDLNANMWRNPGEIPGNGIDDDGDGFIDDVYGCDTGDMDGDPMDDSPIAGHGTHVSGIIGAVGNNNTGVTGVCWNVKIMAIKIADSNGFLTGPIAGIDYAVSHGAKVINASWGGGFYSQALYDSILAAQNAGVIFVAAAGNSSGNNDLIPMYPSAYNLPNIIAVMATTNTDGRAGYSNYGLTSVDLGAPGGNNYGDSSDILSTYPGGGYQLMAGTSMASPHVAGACALLLSVKPTLSYSDVKELLLTTTDPVLPGLCVSGGRMNLAAAMQEAVTDSTPPSAVTWDIEPKATGFHTVSMRAQISTDISGVEYYFECVNDVTINSGWEPNTLYTFTALSPSTPYSFHFKVRDKSPQQNQTGWSDTKDTTTAPLNNDNLKPAADPARWAIKPRIYRLTPPAIRMKAFGVDESGVQFRFKYWDNANPAIWNWSGPWQDSDTWIFTSGIMNHTYSFQCVVRDKSSALNTTELSTPVSVGLRTGPRIIPVPAQYGTIQAAIDAAADGDIVEVSPYSYPPYTYNGLGNFNLTFRGKSITVRSTKPENPDIVAATVIDCGGISPRRGFIFNTGEGRDSVLAGLTIRNAYVKGATGTAVGDNGGTGMVALGAGILCGALDGDGFAGSPTIRNCVIESCVVEGGDGGNGADGADGTDYVPEGPGNPGDPNAEPPVDPTPGTPAEPATPGQPGGDGGRGGFAAGGGISCSSPASPLIENCIIRHCYVRAGIPGNGGNGGAGGNDPNTGRQPGGDGGNGGYNSAVSGGGIFVDQSSPPIIGCTITDCNAFNLTGVGAAGIGGAGNPPGQNGSGGLFYSSVYGGGVFYGAGLNAANISSTIISLSQVSSPLLRNIDTNELYYATGGGIFLYNSHNSTATMTDCNITGNDAGDGGGVGHQGDIILRNCNLTDNNASHSGGGSYSNSADIEAYDSNYADNNAVFGGGMYLENTNPIIDGGAFTNNDACEGGAINGYNCNVTIKNSQINGNRAIDAQNNRYGLGGGLAFWNTQGQIIDSNISGNDANSFGGAAFITGWTTSPINFINCLISDNSAVYEGGGLSCNLAGWARLDNCTVVNNTVTNSVSGTGGGVISTEWYAWVEINNSILWGNYVGDKTKPQQIAIGSPLGPYCDGTDRAKADVDVSFSDVEGGESGVYLMDPTYDCTALWWLAGNIDDNPLFVDTTINEPAYYLSQVAAGQLVESRCVDTGLGDAQAFAAFLGHPITTRTDQKVDTGIIDRGYHYQVNPPLQYSLVIVVANDVGGRLFAQGSGDDAFTIEAPNSRIVKAGAVVSLQALADAGYSILSWTGTDNDAITGQNNTVTMNSNKVVTVTFHQYRLTIEVLKPGAFDPDGYLVATGDPFDPFTLTARNEPNSRGVTPGEVVQLEAFPDANFRVASWQGSDDDASTALTNTVTMDSDKTVVVSFDPIGQYYLTVSVAGGAGTVDPNGRSLRDAGEAVTLTANPSNPSDVMIWSGTDNDNLDGLTNMVTMTGHKNVTVEFYTPRILYVGGNSEFTTIQAAIDAANERDIVILMPSDQPYYTQAGFSINGTNITITSINPGDPAVVASTIIQQQAAPGFAGGPAFQFNNVGPLMRLWGITIRGFSGGGLNGRDGAPPQRSFDGEPGGNASAGGLSCEINASPTIMNCMIDNSHINGGNGGNGSAGTGSDTNTTQIHGGNGGWPGYAHGGGMTCFYNSSPTLINCTFSNCSVTGGNGGNGGNGNEDPAGRGGRGGGWYYGYNIPRPWNFPLDYGEYAKFYSGLGGAVYISYSCAPTFEGCTFINNIASGGVNGICGQNGITHLTEEPGLHYRIDNLGGAVYLEVGSYADFNNCTFTANTADTNRSPASFDGFLGFGGAIAAEYDATLVIRNCLFSNNTSDVGGGVYTLLSYPQVIGSDFADNNAIHGGGMLLSESFAYVAASTFSGNIGNISGSSGGAIALLGTDAEIADCNITGNRVGGSGGGIFISSKNVFGGEIEGDNSVLVKNCLITGNAADLGGGGISANWYSDPNIVNCTITGNASSAGPGGGLYSNYNNYTTIVNSIIWDNSAFTGNEIAVGVPVLPSRVDVSYSDINQTTSSLDVQPGSVLNRNAGVINANPLFMSTGISDYYLSQTAAGQLINSPCVDTGIGDVNDPGIELGDGYTTRIDNVPDKNIVDMGYHHFGGIPTQYALTLEVFDSGYGTNGRLNAKPQPQAETQFDVNDPNTILVNQETTINLTAIPEPNFRVQSWSGTDNDNSTALTNTVTMHSDKTIVVTFEPNGAHFLNVSVEGGQGTVDPNGTSLRASGEVVTLTATPSNPSDVIVWSGTDNDYSHLTTNTVTMNGRKDVTVRFYSPRILYVGADGDFLTIQRGIDEANDGDIVMVLPGTYSIYESSEDNPQLYIISKAITLTSVNPIHPEDTVILGGFAILNVGRDTIIDGFTIQGNYAADNGCPGQNTNCGNPLNDGSNGYSIAGGGMVLHQYYWPTNNGDSYFPPFSASPTVRNCVFQNCSIQAGHGAAGTNGGDGGWGGFAHGGAVSVGPDSNPLFENCVFTGNRAYGGDGGNGSESPAGHGGSWSWSGIFWDWAPQGGYMDYWRYSGYGGAIYCDTNSRPDFNNCTFVNNIAYGGSCGISGAPPGIQWPHSHYQIDRYGGAVYCAADSKPVFANSIFNGNQADTIGLQWHWNRNDAAASAIAYANLSYGGAIAFEDSSAPEFNNCIINGNIAHIGGGAWSDDAYPNFTDSQFVSNVANDGAGMLAVDGQATILRTDFITNTANISGSEGGAIGLFGTNADIIDCNITRNTSLGYGGGIYISSKNIDGNALDGNSTVFVKNCLITNNRATQGGAGISAAWHSDPNIVNCTITGNVSSAGPGGGLYASYSNYTTIVNSIIWGNSAFTGNEIAVGVPISPSRVDVSYSDIRQTTGSLNVQAGSVLNLNDGVINANPLFTGLGNYYLSQTIAGQLTNSPCVDTGIGDVNDPRIELGGYTTRTDNAPDENTVDMGYHYPPVIYSEEMFTLTISIIGPGSVSVHPVSETGEYPGGTIVTMTANPSSGYRVRKWTGTDNDNSASLTNTVTISENKIVSVEFGVPAMLTVPGDYTTIQAAVSTAKAGDIISIASGVYETPNLVIDKDITLTSSNPDDPCVVAATVIDGTGQACVGVAFTVNTSNQTVLNGITIANCGYGIPKVDDATVTGQNGGDGGDANGAGIYIMSGARPTIKNCIIRNCSITGGDAGNGANADATTNAGRGGWGGWAYGAGIYIAPLANPTIINTTITNNTVTGGNGGNGGNFADNGGDAGVGGNWSDGVSWEVWGYVGDYRFYSGYGAGVYCDRNSSATFIACNITNNTARGGVSGIGGNRDTGIQIPPPDTSYEIPAYGGGVYCAADSMVTFTDCNITGNTAVKPDVAYHVDPYLGHGGGVAFENTALISFVNCNISDNNSSVGGGIYWSGGTPEVIDCNIINNDAYIGGGIFGTHSEGHISNCTIRNNFAGVLPTDVDVIIGEGGGLYASSMGALIEDCLFTENTTDASGGGIYAYGTSDVATTIKNCLMVDNEAGRDGGAISANWESVVDVLNCTIYSNRATGTFGLPGTNGFGGGLYCSYGADTDIKNSIFWDNYGPFGTQIAIESGFEFVQICGTVSVSYSDINGGVESGVRMGNCTSNLIWGPGNIDANALFINTTEDNFRLQQQAAGQSKTSPCVDAGSDFSSRFGLHRYSTRTDRAPDILIVDMGYHYFRPEESCIKVYYSSDGIVNFDDLSYIALSWLNKECTEADGWCQGRDVTYDGAVDAYDLKDFADCWLQGFGATCGGDVTPPTPNPMTWETPPATASTSSITMKAHVAVDDNLGYVEYQFERTVNGVFAGLTGWQTGQTFTNTGLLGDTQYCYRVRASDLCGNVTDWSQQACAIIIVDHNAPTPNPMAWESPPAPASTSSITMVAVTATDDSGGLVQYEFERTINGTNGGSSGWQTSRVFADTGLLGQTEYCYRVRAQDPFGNVTGWSQQACAIITIDANAPSPAPTIVFNPSIHIVTSDVCDLSGEFQFPYQYPDYDLTWWHKIVVNVAGIVDDSGGPVEIRFICSSNSLSSQSRIPLVYRPILVGQGVQNTLGSKADGWRLTYNGDTIIYDVKTTTVGGIGVTHTWTVCAYDALMNSACSASHVIGP